MEGYEEADKVEEDENDLGKVEERDDLEMRVGEGIVSREERAVEVVRRELRRTVLKEVEGLKR